MHHDGPDYTTAETGAFPPSQLSAPRRAGGRWLLIGGLALAFLLTLGVGALLGSQIGTTQAAGFTPVLQRLADGRDAQGQGQCGALLTVSSVNGQTIVGKAADGSSVTIHTTASTQYTHSGQSAAASDVAVGGQIHVKGMRNSDGSITATRIDIESSSSSAR